MELSFIIKTEHLAEIVAGTKTEEYRDVTDRLLKQVCDLDSEGNATGYKPIKTLRLLAGYKKDRKFAVVEVKDIELDVYLDDDGNETEDEYFVFVLGRVIETNL